jgi:hypothetical protein
MDTEEKQGEHNDRAATMRWSVSDMSKWGQISTPYPAEMVRLVYAMCEHDAFASNVGNYIHDVLHTFFPEMPDVSIPSPSTVKNGSLDCSLCATLLLL